MSKNNITIKLDKLDLQKEIEGVLMTFKNNCETAVSKAADEVGKEAVKTLKKTSPVGKGTHDLGHYYKNWKLKKVDGKRVVYNEKYQLTHLLENGHNMVNSSGKVIGVASAQPHIKPVEEWVQGEFPDRIETKISRGLS